jgi:FkbM family methyltransferase
LLLREATQQPVLCIDGDTGFFDYLRQNAASWNNITLVKSFVGDKDGTVIGEMASGGGTGHLAEGSSNHAAIKLTRLSTLVRDHPGFACSKLIKLDTDGYDCRIIRSELDMIASAKPVLFFEYDPHFLDQAGDDGFKVFAALRSVGYRRVVIYENTGDYLLTADLNDALLLEDIHRFYVGRGGQRYCDICAFHENDDDIAVEFRRAELNLFEGLRRPRQ